MIQLNALKISMDFLYLIQMKDAGWQTVWQEDTIIQRIQMLTIALCHLICFDLVLLLLFLNVMLAFVLQIEVTT